MKTQTKALSYEAVVAKVEDLVEDTSYSPAQIADIILVEDLSLDAQVTLQKMGLQRLAEGRVAEKRRRGTLRTEEEQQPLIQTVIETDETGKTVETQKKRSNIPNIAWNHRKAMFRGLAKEYTNLAGQRVSILKFTAEDTAAKLAVLRPQKEGLDITVAAFEATDAALRKYSAKTVENLSDKVKARLDPLWLEVKE
jgi:hypothetical protein